MPSRFMAMSQDERTVGRTSIRLVSVGVLAAAGLLISACSSSGSPSATGAASHAPAPVSVIASAPVGSSAPASAPAPTSSTSAVSSGGGAGLSAAGFCAVAKQEQARSEKEANAYSTGDPAALEKLETDGVNELQKFVAIAPSAIKSDVEVIAAADQKLFAALKQAKFVIKNVDQSALASLQTPAFTAAEKHITTYLATTCGIKASDSN
jgi:hypothetical protein